MQLFNINLSKIIPEFTFKVLDGASISSFLKNYYNSIKNPTVLGAQVIPPNEPAPPFALELRGPARLRGSSATTTAAGITYN